MFRTLAVRTLSIVGLVIAIPLAATAQTDVPTPEITAWHLVAYALGGERSQAPWNVDASLSLVAGQASGSAGCNGFFATYEIDGEALTISAPGTTDIGCPDAWMNVEAAFLATLPTTARWAIDTGPTDERGLYLYDADGDIILEFEEATVGLTPADVSALSSLLDAQEARIDALRDRVMDLERQVEELEDARVSSR